MILLKTLVSSIEVKEENKENGDLKNDFKINAEVNFMKSLLDLVKSGEDITIKKLIFNRKDIVFESDVIAIEPDTQKKAILKEKVKKDCYNAISIIEIHEYVKGHTKEKKEIIPKVIDGKDVLSESRILNKNRNLNIK